MLSTARIGVGLIGAGKHGLRYASHLTRDVPGLRLAAVSRKSVDAGEAQAKSLGARFHADWRALVADPEVEAVIAVVPPTLHRPIAEAVAAARKALLIEKPLAPTGADAAAIVRAVDAAGGRCLMAHTLRWNVVVNAMRDVMQSMGPLRALGLNQRFEVSALDWLDRPDVSGGGIVLHTGVHSFDLVRYLTGREVTRVWCRTTRVATTQTEDNFAAVLELAGSEAIVTVTGCRATAGRSGLVDVACAEGQVVGDHLLHYAYRVRGLERTMLELPPATLTVREVLADFEALLRHGTRPRATLADGAAAVRIAEACMRAATTGAAVDVATP
jgi:predicted dehydrogenase